MKAIKFKVQKQDGTFSNERTKTVYDPNVHSDQKIAEMSSRAAHQAPLPAAGRNTSTATIDGVEFTVTRDQDGIINNVFISG